MTTQSRELFPYVPITEFLSVDIPENSLILCDIDDTVLYQEYVRQGCRMGIHTVYIVSRAVDPTGFSDMLARIEASNSVLMFLTARGSSSHNTTKGNLSYVGIDPQRYAIHYTGSLISKGEYIDRFIDITPYNHVIFIDDQIGNLETVHHFVPANKLKQYLCTARHTILPYYKPLV